MITFLRGTVFRAGTGYLDVDVHGVGYRVWVPERSAVTVEKSEDIFLYTHQHVREDAVVLFGFVDERERDWFELLITVSGIGPKSALQMISAADASAFYTAILEEDIPFLCQLPGIGKKTAQRLVVELKDKVDSLLVFVDGSASAVGKAPGKRIAPVMTPMQGELVEALQVLGYNERQAFDAVKLVLAETPDLLLEDALKRCLQQLDRAAVPRKSGW